jgi:bifunctional UDP-N-acetylglucosamine pyrophosphorylase/glucosamine-1-phosphate N-acetyltransferase
VRYPVDAALALGPERLVVVGGEHLPALQAALAGTAEGVLAFARQERPLGTGHAVLAAAEALAGADGPLLILYGDVPLVSAELLGRLLEAHRSSGAALTVLTARLLDPAGYGRVVRDEQGHLAAIVEERDADAATREIDEINTGVWVVALPGALTDLAAVGSANAQGEVYLTDLVALARERGRKLAAVEAPDADEVLGFNDQRDLAQVRTALRWRILERHVSCGVEIVDPATTFIDADVAIAPGARVLPCTVIEGHSIIGEGCEVGPFAHLRDGSVLDAGAEVGNFTETKQTRLGAGSKAKHLSYLGDTRVGSGANIGAGTITANYDGKHKHPTEIGDGAFIGSGTVLVAPVKVGARATTGAGAIVTRTSEVPEGETWIGVPARPLKPRTPREGEDA